jgi:hypothetical protein
MQALQATISGISPLLMNNPQTVDRFNPYTRAMARINAKKAKRTDDDYHELHDLEVRAKLYFDDEIGVYVPGTWVLSNIAANAFRTVKVSKQDIRASVFMTCSRIPLEYEGKSIVKTADDIVGNPQFRKKLILPQRQVRIAKAAPIFHKWKFSTEIEFDEKMIDPNDLKYVLEYGAKYNGFGDFRPTFGRATVEVNHV